MPISTYHPTARVVDNIYPTYSNLWTFSIKQNELDLQFFQETCFEHDLELRKLSIKIYNNIINHLGLTVSVVQRFEEIINFNKPFEIQLDYHDRIGNVHTRINNDYSLVNRKIRANYTDNHQLLIAEYFFKKL